MSSKDNADYLMQTAINSGIKDPKELSNFMGQMQVESGGYASMNENLRYSSERLLEVFPGRNGLHTIEQAQAITAGGQEAVANAIYGGDWGKNPRHLGNTEPGDGWKYHGRGFVQLTGRANYEHVGKEMGLDLVNHPELAENREIAAKIAVHYWESRVVPHGHQNNVKEACHDINGGEKGLADRRTAAASWEEKLAHGYVPGGPESTQALKLGAHGETVKALQTQLNELGYLDANPDGKFGPATKAAVQSYQRDHGLPADGVDGPATRHTLQADIQTLKQHGPATLPIASGPGLDDPRHVLNANHGLYGTLQRRIPHASEERLLQFTSACHASGITADNLGKIHLDEKTRTMTFVASWPPGAVAHTDLKQPPPTPQQSLQQVQAFDQQVHQKAQQAQPNAQSTPQQNGP